MKPNTEFTIRVHLDNKTKTSMGTIAVIAAQNLEDQITHWKRRALKAEKYLKKSQPELVDELTEAQRRRDKWMELAEEQAKVIGQKNSIIGELARTAGYYSKGVD